MSDPAELIASPATDSDPGVTASVDTSPPVTADPGTASPGDNTASPPDAPTDDRTALLEVVRKVVEPAAKNPEGEAAPQSEPPAQAAPDAKPPTPEPDLAGDPTADELKGYAQHTRKRIEKLLSERNTARAETERFKGDAAKWAQMDGYLQRHDLAAQDVNLLLGIGAAMRRADWKAVRDGMRPYWELANQALGDMLPPDLQGKVESGELTHDAAKELSTTRIANLRLQSQVTQTTQRQQAEVQQAQEAQAAQARSSAVQTWEDGIKARDPDYAAKASLVLRFSQALMAERGVPRTPDEAVQMAQAAYEEAGRTYLQMRPQPAPTRPQPSGASATTGGRPEPKSLMEAAMLGLERARAPRR